MRHFKPILVASLACLASLNATAFGQEQPRQQLDNVDLPVLPPDHPARKGAPIIPQPPEPPPVQSSVPNTDEPPTFFGETIPLSEKGSLVYVLDYSSSMGVFGERIDYKTVLTRWEVVVREARRSVTALAPSVRFSMVVFGTNGGCGVLAWKPEPLPATQGNKAAAINWLGQFTDSLRLGGDTPTGPAVVLALSLQPEVILLLTDGMPSPCGIPGWPVRSHRELIARTNQGKSRIDVFGVGLPEQSAYEFCRGVAADNGGTFVDLR